MNLPEFLGHAALRAAKDHPVEAAGVVIATASYALPVAAVAGAIYGLYKIFK